MTHPLLSANIEWMFTADAPDAATRIAKAAAAGFSAVEMWTWREKDLDAVERALSESGVELLSVIVEPQLALGDPSTHEQYLRDVAESVQVATRLGAPNLVAVAGPVQDGVPLETQRGHVADVLRASAELIPDSVTMILEPLNDRVDHVGALITGTHEGLDVVRAVDSPRVKLLLDLYHSLMMDEEPTEQIGADIDLIGHVQIADVPGRHEPGTGHIDWRDQVRKLHAHGYRGRYGLEYQPTVDSAASAQAFASVLTELGL